MKQYIFFALSVLLLVACGKEKETVKKSLRPVKYQKITLATGLEEHTFSGVAKAENEVNLSFKVGGSLSSVNVKLGDKVRKGQVIATIDPIDYNIQIEQAAAQKKGAEANVKSTEASLKNAEGQLLNANSTYKRIEKLYENNSVALSEYEQAKAGLAAAQAQYDAAKSQYDAAATQVTASAKQVEAATNQVNYTKLIAPINGIITQLDAEKNEVVGSGRAIAVISSEGHPKVEVGVPEVMINKVKKGQLVNINFSSDVGQKFTGKIEQVAFASGSSPTYPVIVGINKSSVQIRPGMAANVSFIFNKKGENTNPKMLAPVAAVGEDTEGNFVFVLTKKANNTYRVEKRTVKIGQLLPDGFEVMNGLKTDELVAIAGLKTLMDGMEVKLLK